MKITDTYKNNIAEIDKWLATFSFSEESEKRVRQYINNPLEILNNDIKNLFTKYDAEIVDYRIPLPSNIFSSGKKYPNEIYLIYNTILNLLIDNGVTSYDFNPSNSQITSNITISEDTIAHNYFYIGNDKRKVWRYLDSETKNIAHKIFEAALSDNKQKFSLFDSNFGFSSYESSMKKYLDSIGTRKTMLKEKITNLFDSQHVYLEEKAEEKLASLLSDTFKIMSEIIGAKLIDENKFKLYLSFNVFDWLLASSGETFHSCIDMNSNYCYGLGMLGMCACPDWGMFLYTDGTEKNFYGIKALHIITRSWACYTNANSWQLINWYPKDIRSSIKINNENSDFKFSMDRKSGTNSKSMWDPISFCNGSVAWIYSDLNKFVTTNDRKFVYFTLDSGPCGINNLVKEKDGKIAIASSRNSLSRLIEIFRQTNGSIYDAVNKGYTIKKEMEKREQATHVCSVCGRELVENDGVRINDDDEYVCTSCCDRHFFYSEWDECYIRLEDGYDVYFGEFDYEYDLRSYNFVSESEEVFWDEYSERYYYNDVKSYNVLSSTNEDMTVSCFSLKEMINNEQAFKHSDGYYWDEPEQTEEGAE